MSQGEGQLLFAFAEACEVSGDAIRKEALACAWRGWAVFPAYGIQNGRCACGGRGRCRPGKHPYPADGLHSATSVAERILRWGNVWDRSNLAIRTGAESGLVVLDVDGEPGSRALLRLEATHGTLPDTPRVRTGGGGLHLYFVHPGGHVRCSAGRLGPGLDVRADGGYVIAPPSRHTSGSTYEWVPGSHPDEVLLAPLPSWLLVLASGTLSPPGERPGEGRPAHAGWASEVPTQGAGEVSEGSRNVLLASLAGSLRQRGLEAAEIEPALQALNARLCRPPLPGDEVAEISRSIARYPAGPIPTRPQAGVLGDYPGSSGEDRGPAGKTAPVPVPAPVVVRLSAIQPTPLAWLWPSRIPIGKLTLLAGDPGLGKSLVALDVAARVTTARAWPDSTDATREPASVLLLSAEDDPADTIHPRLIAAGGDPDRTHLLLAIRSTSRERPFDLSRDVGHLDTTLAQTPGTRLVVLDPLSAYLGGADSHVDAVVRALLDPLATLAARHRVAVLAITHLRKSSGKAIYRSMGSLAFAATARAVHLVEKDPRDTSRRLLLPLKGNLSPSTTGLAYSITATPHGPAVAWDPRPVAADPDNLVSLREPAALAEAIDLPRSALADGPRSIQELEREASLASISPSTLRRARAHLGLKTRKAGYQGNWVIDPPHDR